MFDQFKENLGLARDFTGTVRDSLRSVQTAWRIAAPEKRAIWLVVPTAFVISAIAEHFSARSYYEAAVLVLVAVVLGSWLRKAARRPLP